jgi:hypothetical protein
MAFNAAEGLAARVGDEATKTLIQRELLPWALGLRDPVAERIQARQQGEA